MKKIAIIAAFLISGLFAQQHDLLVMHNGTITALYLTVAPEPGEYVRLLRAPGNSSDGFSSITGEYRLTPAPSPGAGFAGNDLALGELKRFLEVDDDETVLRTITGNMALASIATLLFPEAAAAAGRLCIDSSAVPGTQYTYKIVYEDQSGKELHTFSKTVVVQRASPAAPLKLKAEYSRGVVTLTWAYPAWSAESKNLAVRYQVYKKQKTGKFARLVHPVIIRDESNDPVFRGGVGADETEAEYYVTALDPLGTESAPSQSVIVKLISNEAPAPPSGLLAESAADRVILTWNPPASPGITGFNVYRKESLSGDSLKLNKKEISIQTPYYLDTLVKSGSNYFYYVTAIGKGGKQSQLSGLATALYEDLTPPELPSGFKVSSAGKYVKLEWKASSSKDVKGYWIHRGDTDYKIPRVAFAPPGTSFIDSGFNGKGLEAGVTYFYTLSALDRSENQSATIPPVKFINPDAEMPQAPTPVQAEPGNGYAVVVTIGLSLSGDVAKVNLYRQTVGEQGKPQLIKTVATLPATVTDSSVRVMQSYVYAAVAVDTAGNIGLPGYSDTITARDYVAPATVPYASAEFTKAGVMVRWVTVGDADLAGYNIYRCQIENGIYGKVNAQPVKGISFTDQSGLQGYFYKVRAVDTSGNEGGWSSATGVDPAEGTEEGGKQ